METIIIYYEEKWRENNNLSWRRIIKNYIKKTFFVADLSFLIFQL